MSKKHNREEQTIERLERENRQLKAEVKQLNKWLKKLNKGYYKLKEDDKIEEKDIPVEAQKLCFLCNGEYRLVIIHNRRFRKCQNCGKTGKITILEKNETSIC